MKRTIYALLVGIDKYPDPDVPNLRGCTEDADNLDYFLSGEFEDFDVQIISLLNQEATRDSIIGHFRSHLCQATTDDVVFFHFSGHGSREPAAEAFKEFYPDGWDETLVCYDSRPSGLDLADKELAVLLSEVAKNDPHIVVSLDSCHSGSGTRSTGPLTFRQTSNKTEARGLEDYLDGYYVENGLSIPKSKHLLMASCTRYQTAADGQEGGLYSSGLMAILENIGKDISYADLFLKCRAQVSLQAAEQEHAQHPQFEAYEHFNAYGRFLDGRPVGNINRYPVEYDPEQECWTLGLGAVNGLVNEPGHIAEVAIYSSREAQQAVGHATVDWVGALKSGLDYEHENNSEVFYAELISLPLPPFPIYLEGDTEPAALIKKILEEDHQKMGVSFSQNKAECSFGIQAVEGNFLIKELASDRLIIGAGPFDDNTAHYILRELGKVVNWKRSLDLNNNQPKLNPADVTFHLIEKRPDGSEVAHEDGLAPLQFQGEDIAVLIKATNSTPQKLYFTLIYYGEDFEIDAMLSTAVEPSGEPMVLWGKDEDECFYLEEEDVRSEDNFKLLVTTEQPDAFLLSQEGISHLGEVLTNPSFRKIGKKRKKEVVKNDWFTKSLKIVVSKALSGAASSSQR